jgi:hypothetical protein
MATQIFDDGSTITTTLGEGGEFTSTTNADGQGFFDGIFSSSNSTNTNDPFSVSKSTGGSNLSGVFGGVFASTTAAINMFNPSSARLSAAKLLPGGASSQVSQGTSPSTIINSSATSAKARDWRVSISLADPKLFGIDQAGGAIQSPLAGTGGVIFPYIPQISVQYNARYQSQQLTHSNYNSYFYEGSDVNAITITGDFTVQNIAEGQYLLAAIYFFRSATKMFFGKDTNAGNPPPMVKLNGYGQHYFPDVNCVITQFTHTMGPEVDYLEIPVPSATPGPSKKTTPSSAGTGTVRLPTVSQITVIVQPVYSRKNIHDNFTLANFSKGGLLSNGFL